MAVRLRARELAPLLEVGELGESLDAPPDPRCRDDGEECHGRRKDRPDEADAVPPPDAGKPVSMLLG
jgi:hypothetical protein